MIRLQKILVPTDFSTHSDAAVRYGVELANRFDAELHLLHTVERVPAFYGEGFAAPPETEADLANAATAKLAELPEQISPQTVVVRKVVIGSPFPEILKYAEENDIDLIVLGTHGHGALARVLLGSVAEKVVRKSPCPVLTLRDDSHEFIMS